MSDLINDGDILNNASSNIERLGYDTPATYSTLQDEIEEVKEDLTDLQEYWTDGRETIIGTWDGKPLYRKTVKFTTPSKADRVTNSSIGLPDNIIIKNAHGYLIQQDGSYMLLGYYDGADYNFSISPMPSNNTLYMRVGNAGGINRPAEVTFEYTKTTD